MAGRVSVFEGLILVPVDHVVLVDTAAQLGQLAMQVQHLTAAGTLVQVVDVLGDDAHLMVFGQLHQRMMGLIGSGITQLAAAGVVEVEHQLRVAGKCLGGGDLLDPVPLPEAIAVAKGLEATVGTDAGPGEDDDALPFLHLGGLHAAKGRFSQEADRTDTLPARRR